MTGPRERHRAAGVVPLTGILAFLALSLPHGSAASKAERWARRDLPFRMRLEVSAAKVWPANTPCKVEIDLPALAQRIGANPQRKPIDVASLTLVRQEGSEVPTEVPLRISDSLADSGHGTASWLLRRPEERVFYLYFDHRPSRPRPFRSYQEPVGLGDAFCYNRPGGFDPLGVGMTADQPNAVDWDGDGLVDLIQRNLYSTVAGEPYWGVYFWRNLGNPHRPRFDRRVRLYADGKPIQDPYACCQVMDWNGDGRPDLFCGSGSAAQIYLAQPTRDEQGNPRLTAGPRVQLTGGGTLNYGMRWLDWTGEHHPDLYTLRSKVQYSPTPEVNYTWYRYPNLAAPGEAPRFGPPELLKLGGCAVYAECPNDFLDWDGDGDLDLIGSTDDLSRRPARPCVVVWENTGSRERPRFARPPFRVEEIALDAAYAPVRVDTGAFHGLLIATMGGWLQYWERRPGSGPARFRVTVRVQARGQACSSGGYNCAEVVDWDGDHDLDLVCGNEMGYLVLIENLSSGGHTRFSTPRPLRAGGQPVRVTRWNFLNDYDPEWNLGQSKPCVADWDGDGDLDLLLGNNANRIAYYENVGARNHPRLATPRRLVGDSGDRFSFRKRPVVVDWNSDGLPDLLEGSASPSDRNDAPDQGIALYLRYRAMDGTLRLHVGTPLRWENGREIRLPIPYVHGFEAADWDNDGDFDLVTNEQGRLYLYRNLGSNAMPDFRKEPIRAFGTPIQLSHHETSARVVDWDRDGHPDLVCGGESGWVYFFRRAALDLPELPHVEQGPVERS